MRSPRRVCAAAALVAMALVLCTPVQPAAADTPTTAPKVLAITPTRPEEPLVRWFAVSPNAGDRLDIALSKAAAALPQLMVAVVSGDPNAALERAVLRRNGRDTTSSLETLTGGSWTRFADASGELTRDGIVHLPVPHSGDQASDAIWLVVQRTPTDVTYTTPLYSLAQLRGNPASKITTFGTGWLRNAPVASGWLRNPGGAVVKGEPYETQPSLTVTAGRLQLSFASGAPAPNVRVMDTISIHVGGADGNRVFELRFDHTARLLRAYRANSDVPLTETGTEAVPGATAPTTAQPSSGVTWPQPTPANQSGQTGTTGTVPSSSAWFVDLSGTRGTNVSLSRQRVEAIIGGSLANGTVINISRTLSYDNGQTLLLQSVSENAEQAWLNAQPAKRSNGRATSKRAVLLVLVILAIPTTFLVVRYRRTLTKRFKNQWRRFRVKRRRRRHKSREPHREPSRPRVSAGHSRRG